MGVFFMRKTHKRKTRHERGTVASLNSCFLLS
jgi:hypothetical protein